MRQIVDTTIQRHPAVTKSVVLRHLLSVNERHSRLFRHLWPASGTHSRRIENGDNSRTPICCVRLVKVVFQRSKPRNGFSLAPADPIIARDTTLVHFSPVLHEQGFERNACVETDRALQRRLRVRNSIGGQNPCNSGVQQWLRTSKSNGRGTLACNGVFHASSSVWEPASSVAA